jgi:hypothetical protein
MSLLALISIAVIASLLVAAFTFLATLNGSQHPMKQPEIINIEDLKD